LPGICRAFLFREGYELVHISS